MRSTQSGFNRCAGWLGMLSLGVASLVGCGTPEEETTVPVAGSVEDYFVADYDTSRDRFVATSEILARQYDGVERLALPIESGIDAEPLTIDTTFIPAREQPEGLVIMTLGVHGVEAFAGSAVVQMFVAELLPEVDLARTSLLLVHAVNPWGMKHRRRVNENNIDLNRNLSVDTDIFATPNPGYDALNPFLNPPETVTRETVDDAFDQAVAIAVQFPRAELQQAIVQGQYDHPQGLFYGGQAFEPAHDNLDPLFRRLVRAHEKVLLLDFHTGFGERGKLHFFGAPGLGTPAAVEHVFEGYPIDTGEDDENFYETHGDMILYLGEIAAEEAKTYVGITMEYGTLDSHTDRGAIQSLVNTQLENQGHHHGFESAELEAEVRETFLRSYFPLEAEWRRKIALDTRDVLPVLFRRFDAFGDG